MEQPIVNVDVDGVLYPFTERMRQAFAWRADMGVMTFESHPDQWDEPTEWRLHKSWPVTWREVHRVMHSEILDESLFRIGEPIHHAQWGMATLIDMGFHVRIVTSKTFDDEFVTKRARISTLRWLDFHDIPYDTISFSNGKIGKTSYRADITIDDKPQLEDWVQPGAINLIFDQPWNKVIPEFPKNVTDVRRAFGWTDVIRKLEYEMSYKLSDEAVVE